MKQIVLMYHDIYHDNTAESGFQNATALKYKVSAENFEQQVAVIGEYLRKNNLSASHVEFTFDDGGVSFLTVAAPILEKYGFRGTFFISTEYIGTEKFLDADQVRELARRGHRIGSHSHSHPERMSSMSQNEINEEWNVSNHILNGILGTTPSVASIPNGYKSRNVIMAMVISGITEIHTSTPTTSVKAFRDAIVKGRFAITCDDTPQSVITLISSPITRFRKETRQKLLDFTKAILGDAYLSIRKRLTK